MYSNKNNQFKISTLVKSMLSSNDWQISKCDVTRPYQYAACNFLGKSRNSPEPEKSYPSHYYNKDGILFDFVKQFCDELTYNPI